MLLLCFCATFLQKKGIIRSFVRPSVHRGNKEETMISCFIFIHLYYSFSFCHMSAKFLDTPSSIPQNNDTVYDKVAASFQIMKYDMEKVCNYFMGHFVLN